jgi:hypothetical protein
MKRQQQHKKKAAEPTTIKAIAHPGNDVALAAARLWLLCEREC